MKSGIPFLSQSVKYCLIDSGISHCEKSRVPFRYSRSAIERQSKILAPQVLLPSNAISPYGSSQISQDSNFPTSIFPYFRGSVVSVYERVAFSPASSDGIFMRRLNSSSRNTSGSVVEDCASVRVYSFVASSEKMEGTASRYSIPGRVKRELFVISIVTVIGTPARSIPPELAYLRLMVTSFASAYSDRIYVRVSRVERLDPVIVVPVRSASHAKITSARSVFGDPSSFVPTFFPITDCRSSCAFGSLRRTIL